MNVVVNGEPRVEPEGSTVEDLAAGLGAARSGVAVALNDEVVARRAWAATPLHDGDRVEVLGAMQGG